MLAKGAKFVASADYGSLLAELESAPRPFFPNSVVSCLTHQVTTFWIEIELNSSGNLVNFALISIVFYWVNDATPCKSQYKTCMLCLIIAGCICGGTPMKMFVYKKYLGYYSV